MTAAADTTTNISSSAGSSAFFARVDSFPWSSDADFQNGLTAILGPNADTLSQEQIDELTLQARTFYYERKFGETVDLTAYKAWRTAHATSNTSSLSSTSLPRSDYEGLRNGTLDPVTMIASSQQDQDPSLDSSAPPQYPPSFQEVIHLIQSGQPIPGIRDIPDTVLMGQGTEPQKEKRPKPWERKTEQ